MVQVFENIYNFLHFTCCQCDCYELHVCVNKARRRFYQKRKIFIDWFSWLEKKSINKLSIKNVKHFWVWNYIVPLWVITIVPSEKWGYCKWETGLDLDKFRKILVCVDFLKSLASVCLTIMSTMGTTVILEMLTKMLILSISNLP